MPIRIKLISAPWFLVMHDVSPCASMSIPTQLLVALLLHVIINCFYTLQHQISHAISPTDQVHPSALVHGEATRLYNFSSQKPNN